MLRPTHVSPILKSPAFSPTASTVPKKSYPGTKDYLGAPGYTPWRIFMSAKASPAVFTLILNSLGRGSGIALWVSESTSGAPCAVSSMHRPPDRGKVFLIFCLLVGGCASLLPGRCSLKCRGRGRSIGRSGPLRSTP